MVSTLRTDTEIRSLSHWAEAGREGMEAFYALAVEDYRQAVAARDWAGDLLGHAAHDAVRVLDVACGSGKFPAELLRRGLATRLGTTALDVDLLDPSAFSLAEARSVCRPPLRVRAEHQVRLQDLAPEHGGYDVAWAVHALYAVSEDQLRPALERMNAALRPGGFGAIVHATANSHYLEFATAFQTSYDATATPYSGSEDIEETLRALRLYPSVQTVSYQVGSEWPTIIEGFLQRCVFDDSVALARMENGCDAVADYLAGCRTRQGYRFSQQVDIITWEAPT